MRQILTVGVVIRKRLVNELKYVLCLVKYNGHIGDTRRRKESY